MFVITSSSGVRENVDPCGWGFEQTLENMKGCNLQQRQEQKEMEEDFVGAFMKPLPEELLIYIFNRLNSRLLAVVACVCKGWRSAARALNNSVPRFRTAMSQNPQIQDAMNEVFEDVLAAPFWPDFAVVFAGYGVDLNQVSEVVKKKLPENLPLIACNTKTVMGRDLTTGLVHDNLNTDGTDIEDIALNPHALVVSVGHFPGVIVKCLKLHNCLSDPEVKSFVAAASTGSRRSRHGQPPLAILLFAEGTAEPEKPLKELGKAFGGKSAIAGGVAEDVGQRSLLVHSSPANDMQKKNHTRQLGRPVCQLDSTHGSRSVGKSEGTDNEDTPIELAALVFSNDLSCQKSGFSPKISLKCAVVAQGILRSVGPLYKVISSRLSLDRTNTYVTCERDGELVTAEDVEGEVAMENDLSGPRSLTHIGVVRPRSRQNEPHFSVHEVLGMNDILIIMGTGIRTRDSFRFYTPDFGGAGESLSQTISSIVAGSDVGITRKMTKKEIGMDRNKEPRRNYIGGFMFPGLVREDPLFHHREIDSVCGSLPDLHLAGLPFSRQFGPPAVLGGGTDVERQSMEVRVTCNFYSTTYFLFYTG